MSTAIQPDFLQGAMTPQEMVAFIYALKDELKRMSAQIDEMKQQNDMMGLHLSMMYSAKTIEETLEVMSELGKQTLKCDCDVYSLDLAEGNKLFRVNDDGERVYVEIGENTMIKSAIDKKETVFFANDNIFVLNDENKKVLDFDKTNSIGDEKENRYVNNGMVTPLIDHYGEVLGVVVAKNKEAVAENGEKMLVEFNKTDAETFSLETGNLGAVFRVGLEKKALLQESTIDELTRLQNRNGLNRFLENVILEKAAKREPVSIVMMDIDHFKKFNDTYGHDIGDKCLRQVADTLRSNTRLTADSGLFRFGGEEMIAILPVDEEKAFEIAERLRNAVAETPLLVNEQTKETTQVTLSAGVSVFAPKDIYSLSRNNIRAEFDKYMKKADKRLYKAKENGRNCTYASSNFMKEHFPSLSPTVILDEYLKSLDFSIYHNENGYILYDNRDKEIVADNLKDAKEFVSYLESSGIIESNLLYDLRSGWDNFVITNGVFYSDEEYEEIEKFVKNATLNEWADFIKEEGGTKTTLDGNKVSFNADYAEETGVVRAITDQIDEIKLERISKEYKEPEKNKETPEKKDVNYVKE